MKRSVYSLVLMDDVVKEIDKLAYSLNTSRSNLINQILAERISFVTPEKRMKDIFSYVEELIDNEFQINFSPSDTMMSIKSPLMYKYRPTINYSVELFKNNKEMIGKLKVSFRTQSEKLIDLLINFFEIWVSLENKYLKDFLGENTYFEMAQGKFIRNFHMPIEDKNQTTEKIGNAIGCYIKMLDDMIKIYFDNIDNINLAIDKMENAYIKYLKNGLIII